MSESYENLSGNANTLLCVGPLMNVLKARFDNMQSSEVPNFVAELGTFFLNALELRSNWHAKKSEFKVNNLTLIKTHDSKENFVHLGI
jgi:hypothetical protein